MITVVLSAAAGPLVEVAGKALAQRTLADAALVGGLAVAVRVAAPAISYRATADIDIVTDDGRPSLVEILAGRFGAEEPIVIDGVKVDVIETLPLSEEDLAELDDGPRLFVAAHRWALEMAEEVTVTTAAASSQAFKARVATPPALVATKDLSG